MIGLLIKYAIIGNISRNVVIIQRKFTKCVDTMCGEWYIISIATKRGKRTEVI